jgi:hypothetical protein
MKHLTEDELVLHRYGESQNPSNEAEHLSACRECRENLDRLVAELGLLDRLPVPPRGESYGREVWQRVRLRLAQTEPARRPPFAARLWVLSGTLAALLAAAFLAGRFWPRGAAPAAGVSSESRERILLYAVADHLDRSQIALLEFLHSDPSRAEESDRERRFAEELVSANRLYRQTASQSGQAGMAGVLESLERVLLEVAHAPSPDAREALKRRIESEGILFKLRIVRSELGRREKASAPPPAVRS